MPTKTKQLTKAGQSPALALAHGSAPSERDIRVTIYAYDHESEAANVDVGRVMQDLNCSFYAPRELVQRHFVIGTDAEVSDEQCAQRFVEAIKASGLLSVAKWEISVLQNIQDEGQPEKGVRDGE